MARTRTRLFRLSRITRHPHRYLFDLEAKMALTQQMKQEMRKPTDRDIRFHELPWETKLRRLVEKELPKWI